MNDLLAVEV
jgi:hypothetical protein